MICCNDFINEATLIYFAIKLIVIRFIIISKSFILTFLIKHRAGEVIILSSIMESNLSCYQLKISVVNHYALFLCVCAQLLQLFWLFAALRTVACQAPLSMGFSRQEYWSGLPCPSPEDLLNPRVNPHLLHCRWILTAEPQSPGKPRG